MPIPLPLNRAFFKTWTADMAYVLGFFAADGSMIKGRREGCYIEFTSTDRIVLEAIQKAVGSGQRISLRPTRDGKWKPQYRLQFGSKEWYQDLELLGFTQKKSNTLAFPCVPDEFLTHFIRGYFDGDGCVYLGHLKFADRAKKRWILQTLFTSGSRSFLECLWKKLKNEGIEGGSMHTKKRGFELCFSHKDSLALYRLLYHTAPTSDLFLPRKREKLERAIDVLALDKIVRS